MNTRDCIKYTVIPESLKDTILNIFNKVVIATIFGAWCDQDGINSPNNPSYRKTYFALSVSDGMIEDTYRILMFHEIIFEVADSLYDSDILGFELSNIFLLIKNFKYEELSKKLNSDYDTLKQQNIPRTKQESVGEC